MAEQNVLSHLASVHDAHTKARLLYHGGGGHPYQYDTLHSLPIADMRAMLAEESSKDAMACMHQAKHLHPIPISATTIT